MKNVQTHILKPDERIAFERIATADDKNRCRLYSKTHNGDRVHKSMVPVMSAVRGLLKYGIVEILDVGQWYELNYCAHSLWAYENELKQGDIIMETIQSRGHETQYLVQRPNKQTPIPRMQAKDLSDLEIQYIKERMVTKDKLYKLNNGQEMSGVDYMGKEYFLIKTLVPDDVIREALS